VSESESLESDRVVSRVGSEDDDDSGNGQGGESCFVCWKEAEWNAKGRRGMELVLEEERRRYDDESKGGMLFFRIDHGRVGCDG